jgi:hypothetical protein
VSIGFCHVLSISLSVCIQLENHWKELHEIWYCGILPILVKAGQQWRPFYMTYMRFGKHLEGNACILAKYLLERKIFRIKLVEKNWIHVVPNIRSESIVWNPKVHCQVTRTWPPTTARLILYASSHFAYDTF